MSKLELKHLAPYLPYGLIAIDNSGKEINLTDRIYSLPAAILTNYKLILRPLSDLVKPCLPDERTPAEEMEDDLMMSWCVAYDEAYEIITENEATLKAKAKMLPYEMVEWLFEHHFDIYGLVDQNLAVDINTLQK